MSNASHFGLDAEQPLEDAFLRPAGNLLPRVRPSPVSRQTPFLTTTIITKAFAHYRWWRVGLSPASKLIRHSCPV